MRTSQQVESVPNVAPVSKIKMQGIKVDPKNKRRRLFFVSFIDSGVGSDWNGN